MILHFVTSNKNKFQEVVNCLEMEVKPLTLDIKEIQGNKSEIALDKLRKACKQCPDKYIIIDDTSIEIKALNGFPGPYGKDFLTIGNECIENLVSKIGREAVASCVIGFGNYNENIYELFSGEVKGKIIKGHGGFGFDNLFLPDGSDRVYGDMSIEEKCLISHRGIATRKMQDFVRNKYNKVN